MCLVVWNALTTDNNTRMGLVIPVWPLLCLTLADFHDMKCQAICHTKCENKTNTILKQYLSTFNATNELYTQNMSCLNEPLCFVKYIIFNGTFF